MPHGARRAERGPSRAQRLTLSTTASAGSRQSFIAMSRNRVVVRIVEDESGHRSCVVERVRTGEQQRCQGVEAIGRVLALIIVHASDEEQSGA